MWTGPQWGIGLLGLTLLTAAIISIVIFLAYMIKNHGALSQRILNVLYVKLAITNLITAIILSVEMAWHQSGMALSDGVKLFMQLHILVALSSMITFIEISICSLLKLFSSKLYMWASLNIPHTTYNIIEVFVIVLIQYICILKSGTEKAHDVTDLKQRLESALLPVMGPIMGLVFLLQCIVIVSMAIQSRKKIWRYIKNKLFPTLDNQVAPAAPISVINVQENNFVADATETKEIFGVLTITLTISGRCINLLLLSLTGAGTGTVIIMGMLTLTTIAITHVTWIAINQKLRKFTLEMGSSNLNVSLNLRTYQDEGVIMFHKFSSEGHVKMFIQEGRLKTEIVSDETGRVSVLDHYQAVVNDGHPHHVLLNIVTKQAVLLLDGVSVSATIYSTIRTGSFYALGGGVQSEKGYTGCIEEIHIDSRLKSLKDWYHGHSGDQLLASEGKMAGLELRLEPCYNGGECRQLYDRAVCSCENTGYTGAVCRTSRHWRSCTQWAAARYVKPGSLMTNVIIDIDGPGPHPPASVLCGLDNSGGSITAVQHDTEEKTKVDGFQAPGSFSQTIYYKVEDNVVLRELVHQSAKCQQSVSYECRKSQLSGYGWWLDTNGQQRDFCDNISCNCRPDRQSEVKWDQDIITIDDKSLLPVSSVHFGDTGTPFDNKEGRFNVGQLVCHHGIHNDNSAPTHPALLIPTQDSSTSLPADITFSFSCKKPEEENILLRINVDKSIFCQVRLLERARVMNYLWNSKGQSGNINIKMDNGLCDGLWHFVMVEHNTMEVMMALDIETVVTKSASTIPHDFSAQFVQILMEREQSTMKTNAEVKIRSLEVNSKQIFMSQLNAASNKLEQSEKKNDNNIDGKSSVNKLESFYKIPTEAVQSHQGPFLHTNQPQSPLSLSKLLSHPNVLVPVVLLTILLVLSLVITAGVCGYIRRHKGESYYTQEDVGDRGACDADTAVLHSRTGPRVERRREWII